MSTGWSIFVIVLVVLNIAGCFALLFATRRQKGDVGATTTTGHVWDGIEELNTPLPRWWLWMFYGTLIFSIGYLIWYPGLGNFAGVSGWTQIGQLEEEVAEAEAKYSAIFEQYLNQPAADLVNDPKAMDVGRRLFANHCAACHGSDGGGAVGYPNLTDAAWLYGNTEEAIHTSIAKGRQGMMPPMAAAVGDDAKVDALVEYVVSLSGQEHDVTQAAAGKGSFMVCGACHGQDGTGNPILGAPNLTDGAWVYGGTREAIKYSITNGRNGMMPAHESILNEAKIHVLVGYVMSLSKQ